MTTTIHARHSEAQDALYNLIRARPELAHVTVDLGIPWPDKLEDDHVWVSTEADQDDQRYAVSSLMAKDETFVVEIGVLATVLSQDAKDARDRVDEHLHPIEHAIAAEFQSTGTRLGRIVELAEVIAVERDEAQPDLEHRQHLATVRVQCRAWVT